MEIVMRDPAEVWRNRGRPPRPIPEIVRQAADESFRTGKCGTIMVDPEEEEEAKELMSLLTAYAKRQGKRMRFQREDDLLAFRMVAVAKRKKGSAA